MATFCPYCDEEIERQIYQTWEYEEEIEFECPCCHQMMNIMTEMVPVFYTEKRYPA